MKYKSRMGDDAARWIEVAPGLEFPELVTVTATTDDGYVAEVDVIPRGGRPIASRVQVSRSDDGPGVTGETLRSIPVATFVRAACNWAWSIAPDGRTSSQWKKTPDEIKALRDAGPTDATLHEVAALYRLAVFVGDAPTSTVEEAFKLPRSTAGRWVALARKRGFLGAAEQPGKAGEA